MRTIDRRIMRLEVRLRPLAEDLSVERAVGEMLLAGEWQRALKFLEQRDVSVVREWQSVGRLAYGETVRNLQLPKPQQDVSISERVARRRAV